MHLIYLVLVSLHIGHALAFFGRADWDETFCFFPVCVDDVTSHLPCKPIEFSSVDNSKRYAITFSQLGDADESTSANGLLELFGISDPSIRKEFKHVYVEVSDIDKTDSVLSEDYIINSFGPFNMFLFRFYITNSTLSDGDISGIGFVINVLQNVIPIFLDHDINQINSVNHIKSKTSTTTQDNQDSNINSNINSNTHSNTNNSETRRLQSNPESNEVQVSHSSNEDIESHFGWNTYIVNTESFIVKETDEKFKNELILEIAIVSPKIDCFELNTNSDDKTGFIGKMIKKHTYIWSKNYKESNDEQSGFCRQERSDAVQTFGCENFQEGITKITSTVQTQKGWERCSHILICPNGIVKLTIKHKDRSKICYRSFKTSGEVNQWKWARYGYLETSSHYCPINSYHLKIGNCKSKTLLDGLDDYPLIKCPFCDPKDSIQFRLLPLPEVTPISKSHSCKDDEIPFNFQKQSEKSLKDEICCLSWHQEEGEAKFGGSWDDHKTQLYDVLMHNFETSLDAEKKKREDAEAESKATEVIEEEVKDREFFVYSDVEGLAPKDFSPPRGSPGFADRFVAWRKDKKQMSQQDALNTIITEDEFNQVKGDSEPLDNPADPNEHLANKSNWKYYFNKQSFILFTIPIVLIVPSYFMFFSSSS